jgi:putative thioredoxin
VSAVFDVSERDFMERVIERSRELPVVVDFWAEWCGPCRTLGPALEKAASERAGRVELAKVDVDQNQGLAQSFGIRGIPAVKAFRDGRVAAEFTGAIPPAEVERFFDGLVPSEADDLASGEDEESLRRALELQPGHPGASVALARLLVQRGELDEALPLVEPLHGDFGAIGLTARIKLLQSGKEPDGAFQDWDEGDHEAALEKLQQALQNGDAGKEERDLLRQVMVAIFTELGPQSELASRHRRRLAAVLN